MKLSQNKLESPIKVINIDSIQFSIENLKIADLLLLLLNPISKSLPDVCKNSLPFFVTWMRIENTFWNFEHTFQLVLPTYIQNCSVLASKMHEWAAFLTTNAYGLNNRKWRHILINNFLGAINSTLYEKTSFDILPKASIKMTD